MSLKNWDKPEEEDEDLTVVEEKPKAPPPHERFERGEETVAFVRKSDVYKERFVQEEPTPLTASNAASLLPQRYPLKAALPRDRFAAFLLDTVLLAYINLLLGRFIHNLGQGAFEELSGGWQWAIRGVALFLGAMIYYVFFEAIAGATPGKFLCRLRVVDLEGKVPAIANVFLRNLCRLFDYPILFLVALLSMESSPFYQRLGDRAAHTVVIKKTRRRLAPIDLRSAPLSSTFVRGLGFGIDLLLYSTFLWLYLSAMNPAKEGTFAFMQKLFFLLAGSYFMIFEFLTSTTPGKLLLGRRAVLENGEPLDGTAAIVRNLVRPLDLILGYPLLALTRRKQRLGDLMADTLVIKKPHNKNGAVSLACLAMVLFCLAYLSSRNPDRKWFHPYLKLPERSTPAPVAPAAKSPLPPKAAEVKTPTAPGAPAPVAPAPGAPAFPAIPGAAPTVAPPVAARTAAPPPTASPPPAKGRPKTTSQTLRVTEFYFSSGPEPVQIRSDNVFHRGDFIFGFFKVAGFQRNAAGTVNLVEDIQIEGPNGVLLNKTGVVNFKQTVPVGSQNILFANQVTLPNEAPPGVYNLVIVLRNALNQEQLVVEKNFSLQ